MSTITAKEYALYCYEFSRNQSRLVKRHQPSALVLYENIGSIVAAATHISRREQACGRVC
jgi:hypothetical protein